MHIIPLHIIQGNRAIFLEANIHAREWISSATTTWVLNHLLTSNLPDVRNLATNYDWYFLVVANPDGFVFTHTGNRLWRKTRSINTGSSCRGVDPNRNFGYRWNTGGSSNQACSDVFAGPRAFSEPETRAIRDFYQKIARNTRFYISVHSYGQMVLLPYGHTTALPRNHATLVRLSTIRYDGTMDTKMVTILYIIDDYRKRWSSGDSTPSRNAVSHWNSTATFM